MSFMLFPGYAVCVGPLRLNLQLVATLSIPTVFDNPVASLTTGPKLCPGQVPRDPGSILHFSNATAA